VCNVLVILILCNSIIIININENNCINVCVLMCVLLLLLMCSIIISND